MEIIGYVYILCLYPSLLTKSSKNHTTGYFISIKNAKKRKKPFVRKLSYAPFSIAAFQQPSICLYANMPALSLIPVCQHCSFYNILHILPDQLFTP